MRKHWIAGTSTACLVLTACGAPGPAEDPPGVGGGEETGAPPDIPNELVDYDNTRIGPGSTPQEVEADVERQLAGECGVKLCGITVEITGGKDCVRLVEPAPVRAGGRIHVRTRDCSADERPSAEPESEAPKSSKVPKPSKPGPKPGTSESAGPPSAG